MRPDHPDPGRRPRRRTAAVVVMVVTVVLGGCSSGNDTATSKRVPTTDRTTVTTTVSTTTTTTTSASTTVPTAAPTTGAVAASPYDAYVAAAQGSGERVIGRTDASIRAAVLCRNPQQAKALLGGTPLSASPTDHALVQGYCPEKLAEFG